MNRPRVRNVVLPPSGNTTLDGRYERFHLHVLGVQLNWEFGGAEASERTDVVR
jgi:hypothetical protein